MDQNKDIKDQYSKDKDNDKDKTSETRISITAK